ncbi:hypothetical protein H9P43_004615 [Blastocladiella emersonii ATCC 22665]|nr:hypothetical protein H9P43_004615 [Blastocladiella emersonii ATCC 22665]
MRPSHSAVDHDLLLPSQVPSGAGTHRSSVDRERITVLDASTASARGSGILATSEGTLAHGLTDVSRANSRMAPLGAGGLLGLPSAASDSHLPAPTSSAVRSRTQQQRQQQPPPPQPPLQQEPMTVTLHVGHHDDHASSMGGDQSPPPANPRQDLHALDRGYIGPRAGGRFHRSSVWRRAVHALLSAILLAGMVMFVTIMFSVIVAIGYLAFKVDGQSLPVLLGIGLYAFVFLALSRSVLRTAMRIILWLWSSPIRPASGAQPKSALFLNTASPLVVFLMTPGKALNALLDRFVRWVVDHAYSLSQHAHETQTPGGALTNLANRLRPGQATVARVRSVTPLSQTASSAAAAVRSRASPTESTSLSVPGAASVVPPPSELESGGIPADSFASPSPPPPVVTMDELDDPVEQILAGGHSGLTEDEEKALMRDSLRHFLLFVAILLVLVLPCLFTAIKYGYEAIVSVFSFVVVMASMAVILLTNAANRLHRTGRFIHLLFKNIGVERRLAMYIASVGQESKVNIFDSIADQVLKVFTLILITGLVIAKSESKKYLVAVSGIIVGVCLLFRLRNVFLRCLCCGRTKSDRKGGKDSSPANAKYSPHLGYYDGKGYRVPLVVLAARIVATVVGIACLAYLDLSEVNDGGTGGAKVLDLVAQSRGTDRASLIPLACAFLVAYLLPDVAFIATPVVRTTRVLAGILLVSFVGKVAIAGFMASRVTGYTSTTAVLLTYLSFDLRDGRSQWTFHGGHQADRSHRRTTVNSMITLALVLLGVVLSVLAGLLVNYTQDASVPIVPPFPADAGLIARSPVPECNLRFADAFSVLDMATLASSAYGKNASDAIARAERNPALRGNVEIAYSTFGTNEGVRFVEFRFPKLAPNVSVVSVRGTSSIEDLLQDSILWGTPSLVKLSTHFGTFSALWPRPVTARFVQFISQYVAFSGLLYYERVSARVDTLITGNRTVVMTGHSLGGGIAQIVAAAHGIPALALSSPGLGLSYLNYGINVESLSKWAVNVVPFSDPIPMLDSQVSAIMHLPCDAALPPTCHKWANTLTTLLDHCYGISAPVNAAK